MTALRPSHSTLGRILASGALLALVAACGGGDASPAAPETDDPGGNGGSGGGGAVVFEDPSFSQVVAPVFEQRGCTVGGCHGIPNQADLRLLADSAWASLVNYPAIMEPQEVRVIPGDAANSYLVKKVDGTHTIGNRMPPTGDTLTLVERQNLRNWIDRGAKRN